MRTGSRSFLLVILRRVKEREEEGSKERKKRMCRYLTEKEGQRQRPVDVHIEIEEKKNIVAFFYLYNHLSVAKEISPNKSIDLESHVYLTVEGTSSE